MSRFLLLMLSLCMVAWADASRIAVGRGTPEMDGALTDDGWKNAIAAGPFLLDQQNAFATQQTVVRFLWDDEMLYVAFQCYEDVLNPRQNKLHAFRNAFAKPDDDSVYGEDMVEVLLGNSGTDCLYDVIAAASGVVCDCVSKLSGTEYWQQRDKTWQSGAQVAIGVDNCEAGAHWVAEMAIPWQAIGGVPRMGESRKFLVHRREAASKERSSLQRVENGIHLPQNLGELCFVEKVAGMDVSSMPAFHPGENAVGLSCIGTEAVSLSCTVQFGAEKQEFRQTLAAEALSGKLPFRLDRSGNFSFGWRVADAAGREIYHSPEYVFSVQANLLSVKLEEASLWVNGNPVSESVPLQSGKNLLKVLAGEKASLSLTVGDWTIPYPDGWQRDVDGVDSLAVLSGQSVLWPNWKLDGIWMTRNGLQQILFVPQGIPNETVDDWTMYWELPEGMTLVGASGYYKLYEVTVSECGVVFHEGRRYTRYAVGVVTRDPNGERKGLPYREKVRSHETIACVIHVDREVAYDEALVFYYMGSAAAHAVEVPNCFTAHILPEASGERPARLISQMWPGWLHSLDEAELQRKLMEAMAACGVTEIAVKRKDAGLDNFALLDFNSWNFSLVEYVKDHPEEAAIDFQGTHYDDVICSMRILENPEVEEFLRRTLRNWYEKNQRPTHVVFDYEWHVRDSFFSCYCPRCVADFARFAGVEAEDLTSQRINEEFLPRWTEYCNHRVAELCALFGKLIHEELPDVRFSVYSGYQSERTKLIYGIDWTLLDGKVDFMMCGYGRNEKDLHATQEASRVSRLVTGELVLPDDISQNTAPGWIQKATLLRRCCDATGGYLVFAYASLDGRSFLAMAEVSRILRRFESFFMTGRRRPEALTVSGLGAEEYEVLDDAAGNSLVALMNGKKENRDFVFEIPIPEGKKLYDANGNVVACPVEGVLPADGIAIYVVR